MTEPRHRIDNKEAADQLAAGARLNRRFIVMMSLSTIIATAGLLLNSAAVVIGAMLVAPLMTPIFALAMSVVQSDRRRFAQALETLIVGAAIAFTVSLLVTKLVPALQLGTEVTGRTSPNLLDLVVAVAAGLIGGISFTRTDISPALPGVAVATALVPPLSVTGVTAARGDFASAGGAALLFTANLVSIYLAGALVFTLRGFGGARIGFHGRALVRRHWFALIMFALVATVLGKALEGIAADQREKQIVSSVIDSAARMVKGATADSYVIRKAGTRKEIIAVYRTPASFDPPKTSAISNMLRHELGYPVKLVIRSIITKDSDSEHYLGTEPVTPKPKVSLRQRLADIGDILRLQENAVPGSKLLSWRLDPREDGYVVIAHYRSAEPFDISLIRGIRNILEIEMGQPVALNLTTEQPEDGTEEKR